MWVCAGWDGGKRTNPPSRRVAGPRLARRGCQRWRFSDAEDLAASESLKVCSTADQTPWRDWSACQRAHLSGGPRSSLMVDVAVLSLLLLSSTAGRSVTANTASSGGIYPSWTFRTAIPVRSVPGPSTITTLVHVVAARPNRNTVFGPPANANSRYGLPGTIVLGAKYDAHTARGAAPSVVVRASVKKRPSATWRRNGFDARGRQA